MALAKCRECGKEVSSEAKTCPHCGVSAPAPRKATISTGAGCAIIGLLGLTCFYVVSNESSSSSPSYSPSSAVYAPPAPRAKELAILSWGWSQEHGFVKAEGQVRNITSGSLRNVTAVVTFYDAQDRFITSADALIDYNPILAGQASPFSVLTSYNPAMKSARLEFKELMGGTIPSVDSTRRRR